MGREIGLAVYRTLDANATGAVVKAGPGRLYGYQITNKAAALRYVKLYNKATAPTVGTDTPFITIALPASGQASISLTEAIAFSAGLGIGATTGIADADTTAPTANDVIVNLLYV